MPASFTPQQAALLEVAQSIFILNQASNFPFYYLPGFRDVLGGDGKETRFPCSISWMTRKGLPRFSTLLLWHAGWACMLRAFLIADEVDWGKFSFMGQMWLTGFVTIVMAPMKGPDVALGAKDALHCYGAMLYVFDHIIAYIYALGIEPWSPWCVSFAVTSGLCGVMQALRADGDRAAKLLFARLTGAGSRRLPSFLWAIEVAFMILENALFFVFLFGMCSGVVVVESRA